MKKDVDTFLMYKPWKPAFDALSDEKAGQLIKAVFQYVSDGTYDISEDSLRATFELLKPQIDWNAEKYRRQRLASQKAGKKGGAPTGNKNASKPAPQLPVSPEIDVCSRVVNEFHKRCPSFARIKGLTDKRKTNITARLDELESETLLWEVFDNMERSEWMKGDNSGQRQYGFDWVLKKYEHVVKVLEDGFAEKLPSSGYSALKEVHTQDVMSTYPDDHSPML